MKNVIVSVLILSLMAGTAFFSSCNRIGSVMNGSGNIVENPIRVADFTDVNIAGPFSIEVIHSESFNVILSTDENLVDRVLVSLEDRTLKLKIQAPASFFPTSLKVRISMPKINNLILTDEATASLSGFPLIAGFNLVLKNTSSLNGYLEAENIYFDISGGSQVNLQGQGQKLQLQCTGQSEVDLTDLVLKSANVRVIEASQATLNINGRFDVAMEGASKIFYLGNPIFYNTSVSGGSTMSRK
jgi:hypothetical protein